MNSPPNAYTSNDSKLRGYSYNGLIGDGAMRLWTDFDIGELPSGLGPRALL
jgi:hypothetical protein